MSLLKSFCEGQRDEEKRRLKAVMDGEFRAECWTHTHTHTPCCVVHLNTTVAF